MEFDYFYTEQSDQFAFYRIPKVLIVEDYFREMSTEAKLLYGLLLDRVSLSASSGWVDDQRRVYIIYTIRSIMRDLHCGTRMSNRRLSRAISADYFRRKHLSQSAVNEAKAHFIGCHRRLSRAYFSSAMAGLK